MPFQVFRRHQRKMMAALAIFAMVAFTLDFSLFRGPAAGARENTVVVELFGKRYRRSDIEQMRAQRARVNEFVSLVLGTPYAPHLGEIDTRSIVDAIILEREADRLGLPVDRDLAMSWLRQNSRAPITAARLEQIYRDRFANQLTDAALLEELANQVRIQQVLTLPGLPVITPLDLFEAYRDQREQVSAFAVAFPVAEFLSQVPEPTDAEIRAFFEQHRDLLPNPSSPTPGFKIPRKVQVEYVRADPAELMKAYQDQLTDDELRAAYNARPAEFPLPPPELPVNLFADDPDATLTPRRGEPFEQVRDLVARTVAREKAQAEIDRKFGDLIDEAITPFSQKYEEVLAANEDAKAEGKPLQPLPTPGDAFGQTARQLGLFYEKTPLMDRDLASKYGQIGAARRGAGAFGGGASFADILFDDRSPLYEELTLEDSFGRRFLTWKIADEPARAPLLDEVRDEVVHAWKLQKARPLAEQAARDFAKQVEANGFDIAKAAGTRPVITTSPVSKLQPGLMIGMSQIEPARPSEILQIPDAGAALRDALFSLQPRQVKVAPNQPQDTYYVLTLNQRTPADLAGLYGTFGDRLSIQNEVQSDAFVARINAWRDELRARAGLPPNWSPPDEARAAE